jgi:hypothetical protein
MINLLLVIYYGLDGRKYPIPSPIPLLPLEVWLDKLAHRQSSLPYLPDSLW